MDLVADVDLADPEVLVDLADVDLDPEVPAYVVMVPVGVTIVIRAMGCMKM